MTRDIDIYNYVMLVTRLRVMNYRIQPHCDHASVGRCCFLGMRTYAFYDKHGDRIILSLGEETQRTRLYMRDPSRPNSNVN